MKEIKSTAALIGLFVFSIIILLFLIVSFETLKDSPFIWMYMVAYIILVTILGLANRKFTNRFLRYLFLILLSPILIPFVLLKIVFPILPTLLAIMIYFAFSVMVPLITVIILELSDYFGQNVEIRTIILYGGTSIISVLFSKQILKTTRLFMRYNTSDKFKNSNIPEITDYILDVRNVRMIIYGCFCVILIVYSIDYINGFTSENAEKHQRTIVNSFLIYLAFDRMLLFSKDVHFKSSELLEKIMESIKLK